MPRLSSRCKIAVVFLLVLILAAPWASAAGARGRSEMQVEQLWGWLEPIWKLICNLFKAGASPDPNGSPAKNGASADPNGSSGYWIKAGGSLDPNGTATSQPAPSTGTGTNSDAGGSADPNG